MQVSHISHPLANHTHDTYISIGVLHSESVGHVIIKSTFSLSEVVGKVKVHQIGATISTTIGALTIVHHKLLLTKVLHNKATAFSLLISIFTTVFIDPSFAIIVPLYAVFNHSTKLILSILSVTYKGLQLFVSE
jgi:hypothetical protein